jgi:hypothetical protein
MKKTLLIVFLILIAGCIFLQQPSDEYEIFSNIPTENAETIYYLKLSEAGTRELSSYLGVVSGGSILRKVKNAEVGIVSYKNGVNAVVAYLRTNLSVDDALEEFDVASTLSKETKKIGGRDVTLLYYRYDTEKKNPICVWKDGGMIKLLYITKSIPTTTPNSCTFPAGFACLSYDLNENGELSLDLGQGTGRTIRINGLLCSTEKDVTTLTIPPLSHPIQIVSGSHTSVTGGPSGNSVKCAGSSGGKFSGRIYINYTELDTGMQRIAVGALSIGYAQREETEIKMCDKVMESRYDYKNVKTFFGESDAIKGKTPINGEFMGEYKVYGQSAYATAFSDSNGMYLIYIEKNQSNPLLSSLFYTRFGKGDVCYSTLGKATILKDGGKEACMIEDSGMGVSGATLMREVGDYSIFLYLVIKDSKSVAMENAKRTIFSVSLEGEEKHWSSEGLLTVTVYDQTDFRKISEAKVELYFNDKLQESKYTDLNGTATFHNISISSIGGYKLKVSKTGYIEKNTTLYPYSGQVSVYLKRSGGAPPEYKSYSPSTNVVIDEAKLSKIPIIGAQGQPLVKIVVGEKGTGRDVKAAGNIAAMIGNRAYRKINITASINMTTSSPRCTPFITQATIPYPLNTSKTKLVMLDKELTPSDQNLILVGNDKGNKIISQVVGATDINLQSDRVVVKCVGTNRIVIAGYTAADIRAAADQFILPIIMVRNTSSSSAGPLVYCNSMLITQNGEPTFAIVIGAESTAEESVGAANIATMLGNSAFKKQNVTATAFGSGASAYCTVSPSYSAETVLLNTITSPVVVLDKDVDTTSTLILIGPPEVNAVSREVYSSITSISKPTKGEAVVTAAGTNRILIVGGTEMDTERAADKFIEWFAKKYS